MTTRQLPNNHMEHKEEKICKIESYMMQMKIFVSLGGCLVQSCFRHHRRWFRSSIAAIVQVLDPHVVAKKVGREDAVTITWIHVITTYKNVLRSKVWIVWSKTTNIHLQGVRLDRSQGRLSCAIYETMLIWGFRIGWKVDLRHRDEKWQRKKRKNGRVMWELREMGIIDEAVEMRGVKKIIFDQHSEFRSCLIHGFQQ